ncbi:MAG: DNA glycosylase [Clostridia bacterium]|nr:DNA glycosylase [Clostridia bacterium]
MTIEKKNDGILLKDVNCLDIEISVFCGQAFRWKKNEKGFLVGTVKGKTAVIEKTEEGYFFHSCSEEEFREIWYDYFDLDTDYAEICEKISPDESIKKAVEMYYGIRILKQEPWEALCSFIISQNNNIPRITGIIDRLCSMYGEKNEKGEYSFPSYERLKGLTVEDLAPLRAGFRSKYILDAAEKLCNKELDLQKIYSITIDEGRNELMKIKGVGPKVAECTLLYGFSKKEAFPIDVWVKRILSELYPKGLPDCIKGSEGIAQQYLFHWRRNLKEE